VVVAAHGKIMGLSCCTSREPEPQTPLVPEGLSHAAEFTLESPRNPAAAECRQAVPEGLGHAVEDALESPRNLAAAECRQAPIRPEPGDLVQLVRMVPQEYYQHFAVVTQAAESHCTVIVLDESLRFGIGECWPCFKDLKLLSCALRLGSRVVIDGLQGGKTRRLNGFAGTVATHKREGHPSFVRKKSSPDRPQLIVCVRLDDPEAAGETQVLLEPRFLMPHDGFVASLPTKSGETALGVASAGVRPWSLCARAPSGGA